MPKVGRAPPRPLKLLTSAGPASWCQLSATRMSPCCSYRAVFNRAKNHHRDRQRRWANELRTTREGTADRSEYRPEVLAAVRELSLRQRAVVVLTYWDDLTPQLVASRLGISEGSVRRHLARARSRLRGMLYE